MNRYNYKCILLYLVVMACVAPSACLLAQTEHDAIMMNKNQWCNGATYTQSRWTNYWEGTLKRTNINIGEVKTRSVMYMTNYGITNKLNIMGSLPYVWTSASRGTLHSMKGFQDASLYLKWKPVSKTFGKTKLSLLAVGGISTPATNYTVDFLPLSIGLGSTNLTGRVMADVQKGSFFTTLGAAYVRRSNVHLDRTSYYTESIHYTNEVHMPDAAVYNLSFGIRKKFLIAEGLLTAYKTLGGFDMRRNDMPFPSNRMNNTSVGVHLKYTLPFYQHIELLADASRVVAGRNVGQATSASVGAYYLFSLHRN